MQAKGKPFRKRLHASNSNSKRDDIFQFLPFPLASVSTILLVVLFVSTLSALYIGGARRNHDVAAINLSRISSVGIDTSLASDSEGNGQKKINGNQTPKDESKIGNGKSPSIHSLQDLTPSELHPQAGPHRHIVTPPNDDSPITLVTCSTTVGYLHILVHPSWAPLGAQRFLQMVNSNYFGPPKVALMRCIKNFLCQFGIPGDPSYNAPYTGKGNNLQDDPNWLPEGPTHRKNEVGVKRFSKGYMAYAGGGKNSRTNQFIIALNDNERLGGGSPWEVPWGEVVGEESFRTLDAIYTGYGDKGPSQPRLRKEGSSEGVEIEYPKLDYILGCEVIDSR